MGYCISHNIPGMRNNKKQSYLKTAKRKQNKNSPKAPKKANESQTDLKMVKRVANRLKKGKVTTKCF